jgi:hypothetical protein
LRKTFETGAFTSKGKDYGPYIVYRLQRMAAQVWKNSGLIQRILVGDAYKAAALIPKYALLPGPDTGGSSYSQSSDIATPNTETGNRSGGVNHSAIQW